jgi:DNA-binding transcriptional ArsR family regulator
MNEPRKIHLEANLLAVLAQSTRLKILYFLKDGEQCACKINPMMQEDPSVVSRHLVKMRDAGILGSRREGVSIYYWITEPRVFEILAKVDDISRDAAQVKARLTAEALENL